MSLAIAVTYCLICGLGLLVLLGWFWALFWRWLDEFDWICFISAYPTTIILILAFAVSVCFHSGVTIGHARMIFAVSCAILVMSIAVAAICSIIKYRIAGHRPNYAAFMIVLLYSVAFVCGTFPFIL